MVPGHASDRQRPRRRVDDAAVGDFVGTLLMVVVVVALGSVIAVVVASTLDQPAPSRASLSLTSVAPGDTTLSLLHRNGDPIPLSALAITVQRNDSDAVAIPASSWSGTSPDAWMPGERLSFPLSPAVGADERVRVRVARTDANALLADLASKGASTAREAAPLSMTATITPPSVVADGVSTSLLAVRISHPEGALAVASVVADLSAPSRAGGAGALLVPLGDEGRDGDAVGGDGVWSALLLSPTTTPDGTYPVVLNATDTAGRKATATLHVTVVQVVGTGEEGKASYVGSDFSAPTSANLTSFRVRNWAWDQLYPQRLADDFVLVRIVGAEGKGWSALVQLEEFNGGAYAKSLRVWGPNAETTYVPRNGTRVPLAGFDMDLKDPVGSLQWVRASGAAHPLALYQNAGITGTPRLVLPYMGQDQTTSNQPLSQNTGIFSVDLVIT